METAHRNTQPKKVTADGHTFDSILEHQRYVSLMARQATGHIHELKVHFRFLIQGCGLRGTYTSDFFYFDCNRHCYVVEDVKSPYTASLLEWKQKKPRLEQYFSQWTWRNRKVEFRELIISPLS